MSPGTAPARRQRFLELVLDQMGCPYIWGAKGELREDIDGNYVRTFDCSGLVTFCLEKSGGPDWRADHSATKLWRELLHTDDPLPGDLAFYGPNIEPRPATHVVVYLGPLCPIVGANGGDSDCISIEVARQRDARVKADARGHFYKGRFLGFRSLSPHLTT